VKLVSTWIDHGRASQTGDSRSLSAEAEIVPDGDAARCWNSRVDLRQRNRTALDRTATDRPDFHSPGRRRRDLEGMRMMKNVNAVCAHCGTPLSKWRVPEDADWQEEFFYVCFNDDCPYYRDGWKWMKEQYNQNVSYRFAISPETGASFMIPVWSATATRDRIVDDENRGPE
jgi:hypothetical protein